MFALVVISKPTGDRRLDALYKYSPYEVNRLSSIQRLLVDCANIICINTIISSIDISFCHVPLSRCYAVNDEGSTMARMNPFICLVTSSPRCGDFTEIRREPYNLWWCWCDCRSAVVTRWWCQDNASKPRHHCAFVGTFNSITCIALYWNMWNLSHKWHIRSRRA